MRRSRNLVILRTMSLKGICIVGEPVCTERAIYSRNCSALYNCSQFTRRSRAARRA